MFRANSVVVNTEANGIAGPACRTGMTCMPCSIDRIPCRRPGRTRYRRWIARARPTCTVLVRAGSRAAGAAVVIGRSPIDDALGCHVILCVAKGTTPPGTYSSTGLDGFKGWFESCPTCDL